MGPMSVTTAFDVAFAVGVAAAVGALGGAALRRLSRVALAFLTGLVTAGALAGWIVFALRHSHPRELAVSAGGLTGCALAAAASLLLARALARAAATESHLSAAQDRLFELVEREAAERAT